MDRRGFMMAAAAGLAGGALAAQPEKGEESGRQGKVTGAREKLQPEKTSGGSPMPPPTRTLRKAVMIGMVGEGATVLEKFQILRDCGFEGVELDSPSSTPADEILAAMDKTGLKVHGLVDSVHWQFHLNDPDEGARAKAIAALETALRDGKKFGSISVLLVPAVVDKRLPYDKAWTLSIEGIKRVLPVAQETGVKIAVENVWNNFLFSPLEAKRYLEEIGSVAPEGLVGWHFDIGNVINYGWPEQWVRILGRSILKLHIKDFSRKKRDEEGMGKGFGVELGEGDAGWPALMKALDEVGYSTAKPGNWATAEVRGGDRKRLQEISGQMDRLFAM